MIWDYSLSTNTIWTSFDCGQVEADTYEEACALALKELKYNVDKANTVFKHCDITQGFTIDMDYTQLEVNLANPQPKKPMKYILIRGNITFHHFEADELALFKTDKENKALIHDLDEVLFFDDKEEAYKVGDESESYILVQDFTGEMVFERPTDQVRYNIETEGIEIVLETPRVEKPKGKLINIYYWKASKADLELLGYNDLEQFPYSEAKVTEIILDVINKGYNVQTRNNEGFFTICIDKGNFKSY